MDFVKTLWLLHSIGGAQTRKIQQPAWLLDFGVAESVGFEPTCPCGQPHFEFSRRLLITWFLLSDSVSLVRPQTRMKSGLFEKNARKY